MPPTQVLELQNIVTYVMWAGLLPTAAAGAFASYYRLDLYTVTIPERFR
jgi:hypothetical protein